MDESNRRLEDRLNNLFCRLYRSVVGSRERKNIEAIRRERQVERQAYAESLAHQRAVEAAVAAAEATRREELMSEAARWHHAQQIRAYVEAAWILEPGASPVAEWCSWALQTASDLDPLPARIAGLVARS